MNILYDVKKIEGLLNRICICVSKKKSKVSIFNFLKKTSLFVPKHMYILSTYCI